MRLHELEITAFGPFASTVTVDFDELSSGGLFLLTGATGSGKTSVLDAVCFALYGVVPGDRAGAKHLRSDHASPQTAPAVRLRFSVGDRQLTFTRSPSWTRPKLRGAGETKVQAHVLVEELKAGTWTTLTNRLDDAGLFVTRLLGMTSTQFTQVALLPQGRFQAFLRATSAERHSVLQQLFRTDRFERVEQWLVDSRTASRRASEAAEVVVGETVHRLREAAALDRPTEWTADLAAAADAGTLVRWMDEVSAATTADAESLGESSAAADAALAAAQETLSDARHTWERQTRGAAALADLAALEGQQETLAAHRNRLQAHQLALPLSGLGAARAAAASHAAQAQEAWSLQRIVVAELLGTDAEPSHDVLRQAAQDARAAHVLAAAFEPRANAHLNATARLRDGHTALQSLETSVAELDLTLAAQPAIIAEALSAAQEARDAAARLPQALAAVERCDHLIRTAERAEVVGLELVAARTDVLEATGTAQVAKEHYLDVREARINGMAGELAGQLASGCSCPVCGSAEHPAPAVLPGSAVGRADEDEARRSSENAAFEVQARKVGLATLESELTRLEEQLVDVDRTGLAARLDLAQLEVERLEPLVAALDVLVTREHECRERLVSSQEARAAALLERATLTAEIDQTQALAASIHAERAALHNVPGAGPDEDVELDLNDLIGLRARRAALLDSALSLLETATQTAERYAEASEDLRAAAARVGFAGPTEGLAALLDDDTAATISAQLRDAELRAHAASLTTSDPEVVAALALGRPDLVSLADAVRLAEQAARAATSAHDAARARQVRIADLVARLGQQVAAWAPLRARHRTVAELTSLVEGKSLDNPLRMRLAAYVLAERLRQVVAAANERLARMTDQRYALEHSEDRAYGEQRGGLSLRVRDDWNGVQRDPATLSGGETFVVSLALALGLADTVAHEAGGADIDTLFIDEGFGSLDADTLEDVMDTLDSLRDGGRVVGLVSHVPELRSRITTQLEVSKTRNGSTVRTAYTHA